MNEFSLLCADIPFTITIQSGDFVPAYLKHFIKVPSVKSKPIEVFAAIESRQDNIGYAADQPPVVTLSNGVLTISHSLYTGTYDIRRETGTASVHDSCALLFFIRLLVSVVITDRGGLAIHSSCILKNNKIYIFAGSSGYGKSTVLKMTDNPLLYSDEVTLVRKDETGFFRVHHSPFRSDFHTKPRQPVDEIAGIFFLRKDTSVFLEPLSQPDALIRLLPNIFFPVTERNPYENKIFQLCCDFLCQVKAVVMHFRKDNSFWRCIDGEFSSLETEPCYDYQNH